jgi:hypothetical protein
MVNIKSKYIILIWIIILILFTFYCIFRLKYLKEKYYDTSINYSNSNDNKPIIKLINSVQKQDKITNVLDPKKCKNLYDDHIKVRSLGYNNCETAFSDYISKGFDVNKKYGLSKSLADFCPVSTKSNLYKQCLTALLNKFTNNANMVNGITTDMTSSINQRLKYRNGVLDNVQTQFNPLMFNQDQNDFNTYMQYNGAVANYKDDIIGLVNNYYEDKYQGGIGYAGGNTGGSTGINNINIEGFISSTSIYIMDPAIEKKFFGNFKPINGQFLAFNDINIFLGYDGPKPTLSSNSGVLFGEDSSTNPTNMINPIENSQTLLNQIQNIILSFNSSNFSIIYSIVGIDTYKGLNNAITVKISKKKIITINNNSTNSQTILQLLSTLGITEPAQIIMTYEEFKGTEGVLHKSYKLVNDNLDTILIMNKI